MEFIKKYAHFILAFAGVLFGTVVLLCISPSPIALIISTLFVALLGFWYEWHQVVDPDMLDIYGSLDRFITDSKGDVRQDLMGVFVGAFVSIPVWLLVC